MMGKRMQTVLDNVINNSFSFWNKEKRFKVKVASIMLFTIGRFVFWIWLSFQVYNRMGFEKTLILYITICMLILRYSNWKKKNGTTT